ncbi:hypothetical protein KHQ82_05380 [Mycoplasmatota bacterium]|nr:hypothetical protein KHQ82_05380 [Mycoplasmatota bacterium]
MFEVERVDKIKNFLDRLARILKQLLLIAVIYIVYNLIIGTITPEQLLRMSLVIAAVVAVIAIVISLLYKFIWEYVECEILRKKSAQVLVDTKKIPMVRQVSGDQGRGKDASTTASAILIRKMLIERDLERMEVIRDKLYIYDFDKVHDFLDSSYHGRKFIVNRETTLKQRFVSALRKKNSFLLGEYRESHSEEADAHILNYLKRKEGLKIYRDGITPGGVAFLDLLLEYFIYYVRYVHVTNYILSNQPIIEVLEMDKNNKVKELLMSKKFKQSIIRIKEDNSFPVTHSMIVVETETAILNGNVDKAQEQYVKAISGIREFFTLIRHLLGEDCFYYTITQDPFRPIKAVRELQQCYMEVFGSTERCTSPVIRKTLGIYIKILKLMNKINLLVMKLDRDKVEDKFRGIKRQLIKTRNKLGAVLEKLKVFKIIKKAIFRNKKRISRSKEIQDKLDNNGYIEFQIGVYKSIKDVGKKVKFPKMFEGVILENESEAHEKRAFGFRLTCRKKDTWCRYDTKFLSIFRRYKTYKHSETFYNLINWESLSLNEKDIEYMDYGAFNNIMDPLIDNIVEFDSIEDREKRNLEILTQLSVTEPKKFNKMIQNAGLMKKTKIVARKVDNKVIPQARPNYNQLDIHELMDLACERGYEEWVIQQLVTEEVLNQDDIESIEDFNEELTEHGYHKKDKILKFLKYYTSAS